MANDLNDKVDPIAKEGHEIHVIDKEIPAKCGAGAYVLEIFLWILALIPGIIFEIVKRNRKAYFKQMEQSIQAAASEIDNMMDNKLMNMQELCANKNLAIKLDQKMIEAFEKARTLNSKADALGGLEKMVNVSIEKYPELQSHGAIASYMRDVKMLNSEITAARTKYNDLIRAWNSDIFAWPCKVMVAAKVGYTTKIPFAISLADKAKASRGTWTDENILDK